MGRMTTISLIAGLSLVLVAGAFGGAFAQPDTENGECEDPLRGSNIRFREFWTLTDFCQSSIDFSEVISGGPPPETGIPALDDPQYESIEDANAWLVDQSPVVAVTVNDETRAYPLAVLTWHEIVNTELGGEPITVTFCPLCNSAIVFDRNVEGAVLDFGVSGNLRNSDLIMYDRQSQSWWQQFTGEGIVGQYTGTMLTMLPSQIVGFGQFAEEHPDGEVLSRNTGFNRSYGANPYSGYDSTTNPFLFAGEIDDRLPATSRVLAGFIGGQAIAYPFEALQTEGVINDTVDGREIVALWQSGVASALDQRQIDASRDVGTAAIYSRELEDGTVLTFNVEDGVITDDQTGSEWNSFGRAESGELEGTQLRQIVAGTHFWFAWTAFQPEAELYTAES